MKMKKLYSTPNYVFLCFSNDDVVTASGDPVAQTDGFAVDQTWLDFSN